MKKLITIICLFISAFSVYAQNPKFNPGTITIIGSGLNQTMQQIQYPTHPTNCYVLSLKKLRWYYIGSNGVVSGFKTSPWYGNGQIDITLPSHCQGKIVYFYEEIKWFAPQGTQTNWTSKIGKVIN